MRTLPLVAAVCALAAVVGGLATGPVSAGRASVRAETVHAVGRATCTFIDPSRTTFDYATGATLADRRLVTEISFPASVSGESTSVTGHPTVLFAPGYDVNPDTYAALIDAWVRSGLVVVAPIFPDTNPASVAAARVGDPEDDVVNQPADLAFVARRALAASRARDAACPELFGLIDSAELGLAGQSDGGETVAMLAYDRAPAYRSLAAGLPFRAAAVLSGAEIGPGPFEATFGDPALLVVQSSTDRCNPPQDSAELYESIVQKDRWFLTIADAPHLPPYNGADPAAFAVVAAVTARFFRLELTGKVPAAGFLEFGNSAPTVARMTTGPAAPSVPELSPSAAACYER